MNTSLKQFIAQEKDPNCLKGISYSNKIHFQGRSHLSFRQGKSVAFEAQLQQLQVKFHPCCVNSRSCFPTLFSARWISGLRRSKLVKETVLGSKLPWFPCKGKVIKPNSRDDYTQYKEFKPWHMLINVDEFELPFFLRYLLKVWLKGHDLKNWFQQCAKKPVTSRFYFDNHLSLLDCADWDFSAAGVHEADVMWVKHGL